MTQPGDNLPPTELASPPATVSYATTLPHDGHPVDTVPEVPGYVIEAVLGRGGMGVVYKARHLALKRTVALKMILAGAHAGERERARFKAEAEAVGRLNHPGIVQIHEIGEHAGHPFCALEFVEGGSLAQKVAAGPLAAKDAARLVEALARAMHLAHSRNVVHRDLKPANVLLTADGQPKVTDFGLARRLDEESDRTHEGTVLGTPSYMAPEQALGHAHEAGPAADIYALGAILYACRTGQPPFKGTTLLETMEQVRTREPVPPRSLNPSVPRDLEVICLKCLRKEPEKRYASAAELADELARWLHGEPIQARPVGRLERGWRWAARNPALALALTAAVVFLIAGAVVASLFAVEAIRQADKFRVANIELEGQMAQTALWPLATQSDPLTAREVAVLYRVAGQRGKPIAPRYIREALTDPELTPILRYRSAYVWQAVLGLDRHQRDEAERLLLAELHNATGDRQVDLAWSATTLNRLAPETAGVAGEILLGVLRQATEGGTQNKLAQGLAALIVQMEPEAAHTIGEQAAAILNQELARSLNAGTLRSLAEALATLAATLEPDMATRVSSTGAKSLSRVFVQPTNPAALRALAPRLALLIERMRPGEAAGLLHVALSKNTDVAVLHTLGESFRGVARRLSPDEAANAAAGILETLRQSRQPGALNELGAALGHLADRLTPAQAIELRRAGVSRLLLAITDTTDAMTQLWLTTRLAELTAGLPTDEATASATKAATPIFQGLAQATNKESAENLAQALGALAPALRATDVQRAAAAVAGAIRTATDPDTLRVLGMALRAIVSHLDGPASAAACAESIGILTRFLDQSTDSLGRESLALALSDLVPHMDSTAATRAGRTLVRGIQQVPSTAGWGAQAACLAAVAGRMNPDEGKALCTQAARSLIEVLRQGGDPLTMQNTGQNVAALVPWLSAEDLRAASAALTGALQRVEETWGPGDAMRRLSGATALEGLAESIAAVAARLAPDEALRTAQSAADTLLRALSKQTDESVIPELAQGLLFLAPWLGPKHALLLSTCFGRTSDSRTVRIVTLTFSAILAREQLEKARRRSAGAVALVGQGEPWAWLTAAGALPRTAPEPPPPLPAQALVDLLRDPLSIGPARRPILDQLARHYNRTFTDQWDFVTFAQERKFSLDLLGPAPRP
jgi:tRNA A-37 threonylcarbamoyl transferase component Bud32